jgi:hypothetical protein
MAKSLDPAGWFFEKVASEVQWRSVGEIPNFPAADFQDFVRKVHSSELAIVVDSTAANNLTYVFGMGNVVFATFLSWIPMLTALCLIVLALTHGNYWLVCGVPLALLAIPFGGVRVGPFVKLDTLLSGLMSLVILWWLYSGRNTAAMVAAAFVFPLWTIRYWQYRNARKLARGTLESELLLLYLLQKHGVVIRNVRSGAAFTVTGKAGS